MKNKLKKLNYIETREEIHKILIKFYEWELLCSKDNEFDFEWMEFRTDEILKLIQRQGGTYAE